MPPTGRGNVFDLADFSNVYFPHDWYVVYDKLLNITSVILLCYTVLMRLNEAKTVLKRLI